MTVDVTVPLPDIKKTTLYSILFNLIICLMVNDSALYIQSYNHYGREQYDTVVNCDIIK